MKIFSFIALFVLGFFLGIVPSRAQILLTVNDSNPNTVTITATTGLAKKSASNLVFVGFDLTNFFTSGVTPLVPDDTIGSNLQPTQGGDTLFGIGPDDVTVSGVFRDINLFSNFFEDTEVFTINKQAFSGSFTWDLSDSDHAQYQELLPANGAVGNIEVGGTVIGTWEVVNPAVTPEPSTLGLAIGGAALLLVWQRRRSSARCV